MSLRRAINEVLHPEKIEEGEDVYDKFGIQITKTRLKGGIGYQINYGERGRYIQVLKKDMNNLMKAMKTAIDAKQEIRMKDYFQLIKEISQKTLGSYMSKASMGDRSDSALRRKAKAHATLGDTDAAAKAKKKADIRKKGFNKALARTGFGPKGAEPKKDFATAKKKMPDSYKRRTHGDYLKKQAGMDSKTVKKLGY